MPVGVIPIPDTPQQLLDVAAVLDGARALAERAPAGARGRVKSELLYRLALEAL